MCQGMGGGEQGLEDHQEERLQQERNVIYSENKKLRMTTTRCSEWPKLTGERPSGAQLRNWVSS